PSPEAQQRPNCGVQFLRRNAQFRRHLRGVKRTAGEPDDMRLPADFHHGPQIWRHTHEYSHANPSRKCEGRVAPPPVHYSALMKRTWFFSSSTCMANSVRYSSRHPSASFSWMLVYSFV